MQNIQTAAVYSIGENKGQPRLWMQGNRPASAGFQPHARYAVDVQVTKGMVVLSLSEAGTHTVTPKTTRGGKVVPAIDLNSSKTLGVFKGMNAVRVFMMPNKIFILPLATELRKKERLDRLKSKLEKGEPLVMGSVSHGAGVLSNTLEKGLNAAGIKTHLSFANDISHEMIEHSVEVDDSWNDQTLAVMMPLQEAAYDDYLCQKLGRIDGLSAGLPCSGASVAGRAKRKLAHPEAHPLVGHLVVPFIALIAKTNPSFIELENVGPYQSSSSMDLLRNSLRDLGYVVHETILDASEFNVLEKRKRLCMVAVTEGLDFDFECLQKPEPMTRTLSEIMEDIPDDDPAWGTMPGLVAKQERDKAAGKGFMMQIFGPEDTTVSTMTKDMAKNRSTDPKFRNPRTGLLRVPKAIEHARCKGIDDKFVASLSETFGHQVVGQAITPPPFFAVGKLLGETLLKFLTLGWIAPKRKLDEDGNDQQYDLLAVAG